MAITLVSTTFLNKDGEKSFGFRLYDEYGQTYCNCWGPDFSLPESFANDMETLKQALLCDQQDVKDMLHAVAINRDGIFVDDQWYDWDEIRHLFP